MSSHVNKKVNNKFLVWLNKKYGKHGEVKASRGKLHNYLGLTFDFCTKGKVRIDMRKYMCKIIEDFEKKYVLNPYFTEKHIVKSFNKMFLVFYTKVNTRKTYCGNFPQYVSMFADFL